MTRTYSANLQNSTRLGRANERDRDQHAALFGLINKSRLLSGWSPKTAAELDATIRVWAEVLNQFEIPLGAYPELYQRAVDLRQWKMANGHEPPNIDATLLVSRWTGEGGLAAEYRRREVEAGRTLAAGNAYGCRRCFGSGWEIVDTGGGYTAARRCDHAAN